MIDFLKSRSLSVLIVSVLLFIILVTLYGFIPQVIRLGEGGGEVLPLVKLGLWFKSFRLWLLLIPVVMVSVMLVYNCYKFDFFGQSSWLPALIYSILVAYPSFAFGFCPEIISSLVVAVALFFLHTAIHDSDNRSSIMTFGFLVFLGVFITPMIVILLPWSLLVILLSGRSGFKDILALIIGWLSCALLLFCGYYWFEILPELPSYFTKTFWTGIVSYDVNLFIWIKLGLLSILSIMALYYRMIIYPMTIVKSRWDYFVYISLLCAFLISVFIFPYLKETIVFFAALPLSILLSHMLFVVRHKRQLIILFWLIVLASLLPAISA